MNKIEILAPVGSMSSVYPAVRLGANAVYFGAQRFGARANAHNFDKDEAKDMVEYCHARGVKVYVTMNTLIKDTEMKDAILLAEYLCSLPIDAVIVQDLGFAKILKKCSKDIRLHASTQMSVHTLEGTKMLSDLGFSRVVLARELSKNEILEIKRSSPIELEVFVHGALCMSVSGQCYYSAVLGGRSGNRGLCAQPCRLPMKVLNSNSNNVLSLKDMSHIQFIKELEEMGIDSIKIEGRMKRPEYVAATVDACRTVIDGKELSNIQKDRLVSIFSRSGFTSGYYEGKRGKEMFGIRTKEDVIASTSKKLSEIRNIYAKERSFIPVRFSLNIKNGERLKLHVEDCDGNACEAIGCEVIQSTTSSITKERCCEQISKTGGTPFKCIEIDIFLDKGANVAISSLNAIRRDCLKKLEDIRKKRKGIIFNPINEYKQDIHAANEMKLRARFLHTDIPDCFKKCELIYVPLTTKQDEFSRLLLDGFNVAVEVPRGMFSSENEICTLLEKAHDCGVNHALVGNIGAINLVKRFGYRIHGSFGLNVMNSYSLCALNDLGIEDTELSFELSLNEIKKLGGSMKRGIIAYGRFPLMLVRNCPGVNSFDNCLNNKNKCQICDRKKIKFPMVCDGNCTEILNSVPTYLGDRIDDITGIDFMTMRFTVENSVESEENFKTFNNDQIIKNDFTRGLYYRSVN